MADSYKITDGTTEYEVIYNASTQPDYKAMYGASISALEPSVLLHSPDDSAPLPVRAWDQNRTVFVTLDVLGDDWDEILNDIHEIKRMISGANSQAIKYWLNERNENRVVLRVQLDGATNYSDIPILWGSVDDSGSYYTDVASINKRGRNLVIALIVSPYSEGALETARNEITNTSPYVFTAGLATGWTNTGMTVAQESSIVLINQYSQKATTVAGGETIDTPTLTTQAGDTHAGAFIWVYSTSVVDTIVITLEGSTGGTLDTVNLVMSDPTATASKTAVDSGGRSWYRCDLTTAAVTGTENLFIRATCNAVGIGIWLCGAYINAQNSAVTVPSYWVNTDTLENRGDIDTSNVDELNWLDIWGVPGDAPALVRLEMETNGMSTNYGTMYTSRWRDTMYNAGDLSGFAHWVEDASLTNTGAGGGTYASVADAGRTAGNYVRYTDSGAASETGFWRYTVSSANVPNFFQWPRRVYLLAYADDTGVTFALKSSNIVPQITEARSPQTASTWELIDIGMINGVGIDNFDYTDIGGATVDVNIDIEFVTTSTQDVVQIDAIYFAPAAPDGFMIADGDIGGFIAIFPFRERVGFEARLYPDILGQTWTAEPGNRLTRSSFAFTNDSGVWDITDSLTNILVKVKPRAYHLLGTQ